MISPESLQQCIHPVIFRTGISETPLLVWGIGFLLGTKSRVIFVTARHLLSNTLPDDICVISPSGRLVPLKDSFILDPSYCHQDWADVAIFEVSLAEGFKQSPDARLIHLSLAGGDWKATAATSRFFVAGFTREHSGVDYETKEVYGGFVELSGKHLGPASCDSITHRLGIIDPPPLESFAGLSGSPVLMLKRQVGMQNS